MVWWLEGVTFRHFGWVRNPSEANFSYFWNQGKNQKFFFPGKIGIFRKKSVFYREISVFIGKYRYLSEKSAIFRRFFAIRFFHCKIFSRPTEIRFFSEKSADFGDFFVPGRNSILEGYLNNQILIQLLASGKSLPFSVRKIWTSLELYKIFLLLQLEAI